MEIVAKLTCYMTLVSRDEQKLKNEKGEEERERRQTKEQINKKQRKKKMAEDWGEKGVVSHSIPCQYVSSRLTEILKQAITMQSPRPFNTVKPVLSGPGLSTRPLLNGHFRKSRKSFSLFSVKLTYIWRSTFPWSQRVICYFLHLY